VACVHTCACRPISRPRAATSGRLAMREAPSRILCILLSGRPCGEAGDSELAGPTRGSRAVHSESPASRRAKVVARISGNLKMLGPRPAMREAASHNLLLKLVDPLGCHS
jgi:hypothetical protein